MKRWYGLTDQKKKPKGWYPGKGTNPEPKVTVKPDPPANPPPKDTEKRLKYAKMYGADSGTLAKIWNEKYRRPPEKKRMRLHHSPLWITLDGYIEHVARNRDMVFEDVLDLIPDEVLDNGRVIFRAGVPEDWEMELFAFMREMGIVEIEIKP